MYTNKLVQLRNALMHEYLLYKQGCISQKEYQKRAKPIDMKIMDLEMSILRGSPAWIEAFSQHTLKQAH